MTKGYIIFYYNTSQNNQETFDGIYLDPDMAQEEFQQINYWRQEPIIYEFNFIECEPQNNKDFYVFQRNPLGRIIFGIFDDEWIFDGLMKELIESKNKDYRIGTIDSLNPDTTEKLQQKDELRDQRFKILFNIIGAENEQRRKSMSSLLSGVASKVYEKDFYRPIILQIKEPKEINPETLYEDIEKKDNLSWSRGNTLDKPYRSTKRLLRYIYDLLKQGLNQNEIINLGQYSRPAIYQALRELEDLGFIDKRKNRNFVDIKILKEIKIKIKSR